MVLALLGQGIDHSFAELPKTQPQGPRGNTEQKGGNQMTLGRRRSPAGVRVLEHCNPHGPGSSLKASLFKRTSWVWTHLFMHPNAQTEGIPPGELFSPALRPVTFLLFSQAFAQILGRLEPHLLLLCQPAMPIRPLFQFYRLAVVAMVTGRQSTPLCPSACQGWRAQRQ